MSIGFLCDSYSLSIDIAGKTYEHPVNPCKHLQCSIQFQAILTKARLIQNYIVLGTLMEGVLSLRWSSWVVFIFFLTVLCVRTTIICALSNLSLVKAYMESNNRIQ